MSNCMKPLILLVLLCPALQLHAELPRPPTPNVSLETDATRVKKMHESQILRTTLDQNRESEIARVRKQMHEIQMLPIANDQKIQKQRTLLNNEIARASAKQREIQASEAKSSRESKESSEAAQDRRKAGLDSLQKFLDILRSMNPRI